MRLSRRSSTGTPGTPVADPSASTAFFARMPRSGRRASAWWSTFITSATCVSMAAFAFRCLAHWLPRPRESGGPDDASRWTPRSTCPVDFRNPGVPSDRARLARQGIALLGTVKSAALVTVTGRGSFVAEAAGALRAWVRATTMSSVGRWSPESAGVVTAILIGDRSGLEPEAERKLQEAGTYHVIAISGGNIALLTGLLIGLGRLARFPARGDGRGIDRPAGVLRLRGRPRAVGAARDARRGGVPGRARGRSPWTGAQRDRGRGGDRRRRVPADDSGPGFRPLVRRNGGDRHGRGAPRARHPENGDRSEPAWPTALMSIGRAAAMLFAATLSAEIALAPVGALSLRPGQLCRPVAQLRGDPVDVGDPGRRAGLARGRRRCRRAWDRPSAGSPGSRRICCCARRISSTSRHGSYVDVPPPAIWLMTFGTRSWAALLATRQTAVASHRGGRCGGRGFPYPRPGIRRRAHSACQPPEPGWTRIVFLDVGQGDATLIQPAGAPPWLVDAGGTAGDVIRSRPPRDAAGALGVRRHPARYAGAHARRS